MTAARGRPVRAAGGRAGAGLGRGAAQRAGRTPPRRGSARLPLRLSGVPSARSRALISCTDEPARRSSSTRAPGAVLGRGGLGAGPAGRGEQLQLPGPEVAQQAGHAGAGVAEPAPACSTVRPSVK